MEKEKSINTFSIVAFILSFIICPVGLILSIIGLVRCKNYKKEYGENPKNFAFNIVGLVISGLGVLTMLFVFLIIGVVFAVLASNEKYVEGNYICYYPYSYRPAVSAEFNDGKFKWSKYGDSTNNSIEGTYRLNAVNIENGESTYKLIIKPTSVKSTTKVNTKDRYEVTIKKSSGKITITFDTGTTYNCTKRETSNDL